MSSDALLTFDFVSRFPHKMWISNWVSDETYPDGYRYKIMSSWNESADEFSLLIVLQEQSGVKHVLESLKLNDVAFDRVARVFVNGLIDQYKLDFEEQDFSACRSQEEFDVATRKFGWASSDIEI